MAQVIEFDPNDFLRQLRFICTYHQQPQPFQSSSSNPNTPNSGLILHTIAAAIMRPGLDFIEEVLQYAADGLRTGRMFDEDGQNPRTTSEALRYAIRHCFLERWGMDIEQLDEGGKADLEVTMANLHPQLILRTYEGILPNQPAATASVLPCRGQSIESRHVASVPADRDSSLESQPTDSVPAHTAPPTDNQPTAGMLANMDMTIGTNGEGSQAVRPAVNIPSSPGSTRATVRQHMPGPSPQSMVRKILRIIVRCGIQNPVRYLSPVLVELAVQVGKVTVRIVTSPAEILAFSVFGLGLFVWRYRAVLAPLSLFRTGVDVVDRSILVPVCELTQSSAVDICSPMCMAAAGLGYPLLACVNQPSWAAAGETSSPLISQQVIFSKLAVGDIVSRVQDLDIQFDKSTCETLDQSGEIYEELGSDITQYSREAESLFQLFAFSEGQVNRTLQIGTLEEAKPWYDNILAFLPTRAKGKAEESAFKAHTNALLPRLAQVLATGERIDGIISFLQAQEAKGVGQLRSLEQTIEVLHTEASRKTSITDYLFGVPASRTDLTQTTGQSVKGLTVGYKKVSDASESTARSFKESFAQLQTLDSALAYHSTWEGPRQDKPRKVYLAQIRSAVQQAKKALRSWAHEDGRHGGLFDSAEDRISNLFRPYAWEEMH
ncbi:MAG: hypothetical protein Q9170_001462 [Blastenia crenularia]